MTKDSKHLECPYMSNNNELTDEEYFKEMMKSVKPLRQKVLKEQYDYRPPAPKANLIPKPKPQTFENKTNFEVYTYNHHTHAVKSEEVMIYYKNTLSNSHRKKLQQGQLVIQAKLDLHGLNIDLARETLCNFIQKQYEYGYRCLLIVHGKGGLHGETPILKNHVNDWLQQLPQVLAFHSAQQRHGGTGAVYVLLKYH